MKSQSPSDPEVKRFLDHRNLQITTNAIIHHTTGELQWIYDLNNHKFLDNYTYAPKKEITDGDKSITLRNSLKNSLVQLLHGNLTEDLGNTVITAFDLASPLNYFHFIFDELVDLIILNKIAEEIDCKVTHIGVLFPETFKHSFLKLSGILNEKKLSYMVQPIKNSRGQPQLIKENKSILIPKLICFEKGRVRLRRGEDLTFNAKINILMEQLGPGIYAEQIKSSPDKYPKKIFIERDLTGNMSLYRKIYPETERKCFDTLKQNAGKEAIYPNPDQKKFHDDLKANGFTVIRLSYLSIIDQILLFKNAEVIAAVHGAALSNIIFCNHKTKVIEIRHKDHNATCFEEIAKVIGLINFETVKGNPLLSKEKDQLLSMSLVKTPGISQLYPIQYDKKVKDALFKN